MVTPAPIDRGQLASWLTWRTALYPRTIPSTTVWNEARRDIDLAATIAEAGLRNGDIF